jgi:hypothetical protein
MAELIIPLGVSDSRDGVDEMMDVKVCGDVVWSHQPSTEAPNGSQYSLVFGASFIAFRQQAGVDCLPTQSHPTTPT